MFDSVRPLVTSEKAPSVMNGRRCSVSTGRCVVYPKLREDECTAAKPVPPPRVRFMGHGSDCMGAHNRVPLFINRFSLSPRTAIGVQTLRLLGPHQDWLHFHWWSSSLKQPDPRSVLFENTVLSRYSFLHNPKLVRFCEQLGISSWSGSDLRPSLAKRLTAHYRERVSSVYVAPLGRRRCNPMP